MSSDIDITGYPSAQVKATYGFPVVDVLFLERSIQNPPNIGAPHFLVDMIPANNARFHDKEREPVAAILCTELSGNEPNWL